MGSSKKTPIVRLPQFVDDDKPSFLGDINSAFRIIDAEFNRLNSQIADLQLQIHTLQKRELNK